MRACAEVVDAALGRLEEHLRTRQVGLDLARAELTKIVELLIGDGRRFEVVSRRYGKRVLIPAYESLVVRKVQTST